MPKSSKVSLYQEQMKTKPQIDKIISELIDGELKEAALMFVAYLRAKKHIPQYSSTNSWRISYKGKCLCYIKIENNLWCVVFYLDKYNFEFSEGFKKAVQDNLKPCKGCLKACPKGLNLSVFGKEFTGICRHFPIQFENSNCHTLEYVKELIEYRKTLINTNTISPKFFWINNTTI